MEYTISKCSAMEKILLSLPVMMAAVVTVAGSASAENASYDLYIWIRIVAT